MRSENRVRRILLVAVALWCAACGSVFVDRAGDAYRDGRYLEVAEVLAARENEFASLSRRQRARYAMYRGLSLIQLGDVAGARRWLEHALRLDRSGKKVLNLRERKRVRMTLRMTVPQRHRSP